MADIKIYHNPRCSKSRLGLAYLNEKGLSVDVILYLEQKFNTKELKELINKLSITPFELLRTNEEIYKQDIKGKSLSDKELIEWMVNYPQLIERPIVVKDKKAVIARPVEKIDELLMD
jgi:arsenate reductase (glutaredoxin)